MKIIEPGSRFKYKNFKLSTDNKSIISFDLNQVWLDNEKICDYRVEVKDGKFFMNFTNPSHFGPFLNIEVVLLNGETFLLNETVEKLRNSQRIIMYEVQND